MRLITNESLIKRNATIGKYTAIGGMAVLIGGLLISLFKKEPEWQLVPFITLIIGFILSNVGIYMSNRYVRPPRPDQVLDNALKGFDDRYYLYHYRAPTPHVLICPAGVFAFVLKFQPGEVSWDGKRWRQAKGGNFLLSLFGQESLGNPNAEAAGEVEALSRFLAKKIGADVPPVQAIIVFYNPNVTVNAKDAPLPALHVKQLKEHIRKLPKGPTLSADQIAKLDEAIGIANL
ncbi:MAG: hypothetical protein HYZ49_02150 [Chloroflexi bacterium]|nr:hypothetical protein [Chloroflexota bacterium]